MLPLRFRKARRSWRSPMAEGRRSAHRGRAERRRPRWRGQWHHVLDLAYRRRPADIVRNRGEIAANFDRVQMPDEFRGNLMVFRTFDKVSYGPGDGCHSPDRRSAMCSRRPKPCSKSLHAHRSCTTSRRLRAPRCFPDHGRRPALLVPVAQRRPAGALRTLLDARGGPREALAAGEDAWREAGLREPACAGCAAPDRGGSTRTWTWLQSSPRTPPDRLAQPGLPPACCGAASAIRRRCCSSPVIRTCSGIRRWRWSAAAAQRRRDARTHGSSRAPSAAPAWP
jgi:hypothetical protein